MRTRKLSRITILGLLLAMSTGVAAAATAPTLTATDQDGGCAMRQRNLLGVQKWGGLYDAATAESEAAASHTSMTVCPHA
jgi:hypothetical protein